jgi:hypothetical protein
MTPEPPIVSADAGEIPEADGGGADGGVIEDPSLGPGGSLSGGCSAGGSRGAGAPWWAILVLVITASGARRRRARRAGRR